MKKFFSKIVSFLQMFFTNLDAWIHEHVQPSIEVMQRLKDILVNPVMDIITALIPGDADEKFRQWLIVNLTKAIDALHIVNDIESHPTFDLKLAKLIEYLKTLSPELRKGVYLRLSSLMAKASSGLDTVKGHSIDLLTQLQYSKMAEGLEHTDLADSKYTPTVEQPQLHYNPMTLKYE